MLRDAAADMAVIGKREGTDGVRGGEILKAELAAETRLGYAVPLEGLSAMPGVSERGVAARYVVGVAVLALGA